MNTVEQTSRHWDDFTTRLGGRRTGLFWWEAEPLIQQRINAKISGDAEIGWIEYTLDKYFAGRLPLEECLSLGCGSGQLERSLAQRRAFTHCDAYDVSSASIQRARDLAAAAGTSAIAYYVEDVNSILLPHRLYDAVWIHAAMHHFRALEHISSQIAQALKPGGLLILNEYVGPSRFQFSARQKEIANASLRLMPSKYRTPVQEALKAQLERSPVHKGIRWLFSRLLDKIRDGTLLETVARRVRTYRTASRGDSRPLSAMSFPSARDVASADPSEAIRSADILPVLSGRFEIVEMKGLGGNILQFLLANIAGNFSQSDPRSQSLLRMLMNIEDTMLDCGEFESDYAYIVARPKSGSP